MMTAHQCTFLLCLLLFGCTTATYTVEVAAPKDHYSEEQKSVASCDAAGANFGPNITSRWMDFAAAGCAVKVTPEDACSPVTLKRTGKTKNSMCHGKFYAIVPVGNCSFSEKAYHVQRSASCGFEALIVYNVEGKKPVEMTGGKFAAKVKIPVVMVDYECMEELIERFPERQGYTVLIYQPLSPHEKVVSLLVIIGITILLLLMKYVLTALARCFSYVRERSRDKWTRWAQMRKYRKLPSKKYSIGDQPDTCVICFEEFAKGEKLTVLQCEHMYHYKCIVPWLSENDKCPMCQRPLWDVDVEAATGDNDERAGRGAAAAPPPIDAQNPHEIEEQMDDNSDGSASTYSEGPSNAETEASSSREMQMNVEAGTSENVLTEDEPRTDNSSEESFYSADDHQIRLLEEEEFRGGSMSAGHGAMAGALRSLRSFAGGRSTTSMRRQTAGVDNVAFHEEGSSTTVDDETV